MTKGAGTGQPNVKNNDYWSFHCVQIASAVCDKAIYRKNGVTTIVILDTNCK